MKAEINLNDDIIVQSENVFGLLENVIKKAGLPSDIFSLDVCQKDRIRCAVKNVLPQVSQRIQCIGKRYMPACLAIAACSHNLTPDALIHGSAGVAAAMWLRDRVDQAILPDSKLSELFSDEQFSSLPLCAPEIQDDDPQLLSSYARAVTNRLSATHYRYDRENGHRFGPSQNVYSELKSAVSQKKVQEAEEIFKDRLWAFLKTELKIVKLALLKYEHSREKDVQCEAASSILNMPKKYNIPPVLKMEIEPKDDPSALLLSAMLSIIGLPLLINGSVHTMKNMDWETQKKIRKIVSEFNPLHTSDGRDVDPFTIAFGYQSLLDNDDDLAYLPGISCAMVGLYAEMLPWAQVDREPTNEKTALPSWCRRSNSIYAFKIWFPTDFEEKAGTFANSAQMLYEYEKVARSSINEVDAVETTASKSTDTGDYCNQPTVPVPERPQKDPDDDDTAELHEELIRLKSENENLRKELVATQKDLKKSEHDRTVAEKKANEITSEKDSYLSELRSMRETAVQASQRQPCGDTAVTETSQFPYAVKRKIVIYGGQEFWRHAIRKLTPGVTFASDSKKLNTDLIRSADIVWVQTFAISHSLYNAVNDFAKKNGVPIRRFATNGTVNCASQLAACEREAAQKGRCVQPAC